jgi:rhodanese-related sulfurtransferase
VGAVDETSAVEVDPAQVAGWLEADAPPQLIDVRTPREREAGHIADTRHVELAQLPAEAASIERERPVVFYCRVGSRSLMAAQAFRASGFDAYSMRGGLARWQAEGRPLTPEDGYVADD